MIKELKNIISPNLEINQPLKKNYEEKKQPLYSDTDINKE